MIVPPRNRVISFHEEIRQLLLSDDNERRHNFHNCVTIMFLMTKWCNQDAVLQATDARECAPNDRSLPTVTKSINHSKEKSSSQSVLTS